MRKRLHKKLKHMNKNIKDIIVLVVIVIVICLLFVYYKKPFTKIDSSMDTPPSLSKKEVSVPVEYERSVYGTVESVNGDKINIRVQEVGVASTTPPMERTVIVGTSTNIVKMGEVDYKALQAEAEKFLKKNKNSKKPVSMVSSLTAPMTKVEIKDIAVGDLIKMTTRKDVKTTKEFSVLDIQIMPKIGN